MQPRGAGHRGRRANDTTPMIEIDGLTKRYGRHTVVDNLSFRCEPGEVLGFLGPNGAGKSTTMKMLTGFVAPTSGRATVCGHDVETDSLAAAKRLGYLPEGAPSYAEMTPRTFLDFIANVRELEGARREARLSEVIERLHLGPVLDQSIDTLSKGFNRRVGLAQAILHDPDVLILDEPTDGLDPNQKHEVRELIRSMSAEKLIIISTHILEEVEAVCSRAIIIADGKVLADATPSELAERSRYHNAMRLTLDNVADYDEVEASLAKLSSVAGTEGDRDRGVLMALAGGDGAASAIWKDVSALVDERGWPMRGLQQEAGHLDEVFREITKGSVA